MRFVHAADVHLDSPLRGLDRYEGAPAGAFRAATRRALENLVGLCLDEDAELLVIAGDLYDGTWPDYNTGLFFAKQMARLREANVRVVIVSGNHDAESQITKTLRWPDNVRVLSTREPETYAIPELGVAVHGQGFAQKRVTEDLARRYPEPISGAFNIGLLHTSLDGREGHAAYAPTTLANLKARGYDYWALGHVHAREIVCEAPWVIFPGNLQGRHAREAGEKGATVVDVERGRVAKVTHRALDVVRWSVCAVDASGARTHDEVLDLVQDALIEDAEAAGGRPVAARVRITGRSEAHAALRGDAERLEADVRAVGNDVEGLWVEKVVCETAPMTPGAGAGEAAALLADELARLRGSDAELGGLVERLRDRLPRELREDRTEQRSDAERIEEARRLLDDAEALLGVRLFAAEDAS